MFKKIALLIFLILPFVVTAQISLHSHSTKAIKYHRLALNNYNNSNLFEAKKYAFLAHKKDSTFVENLILLAQIYQEQTLLNLALKYYDKAIKYGLTIYPELYIYRGNLLLQLNKFKEAENDFIKLSNLITDKKLIVKLNSKIKNAQIADSLQQNPVEFNPKSLGDSINTTLDEYAPLLTIDNNTLIFTRARKNTDLHEEDLFYSHRKDKGWTRAQSAGRIFNTLGNEGSPSISADNHFLVFASCNRPDGFGRCDIYISDFNGFRWGKAKNMGKNINTNFWESQACLSADGSELIFVSNRPGGFGQTDLWMSRKNESEQWKKPMNMGKNINTKGNEYYPFLHANGRKLYFSSDGWPGLGKADLFFSQLDSNTHWTKPQNIGYPINSSYDDNGFFISSDGKIALLATNRFNPKMGLDIYQFKIDEKIRPKPAKVLTGIVIDSLTRKPLKAKILIKNNDGLYSTTQSFQINGHFKYISAECKYIDVFISSPNYVFYIRQIKNPFRKLAYKFSLLPIKNRAKSIFHFHFAFDSSILSISDFQSLNYLADFLINNNKLKISIEGHTDNRGNKQYNMNLSLDRAKSVQKYLIKKGISKERMRILGFGASKPLVSNNNERNRALNRRTEIIYLTK